MDKNDLEIVGSIERKDEIRKRKEKRKFIDIWTKIQRLAERYSSLVNSYMLDYGQIKFNLHSKNYSKCEEIYLKSCFFLIFDELVNFERRKKIFPMINNTSFIYKTAYTSNEGFIFRGILEGIYNSDIIRKNSSIFGDYYSSRSLYNYTGGKNSIGQSQRNKLIRDGVIVRLSTKGRTKLFLPEYKLAEFLEIRLNHFRRNIWR